MKNDLSLVDPALLASLTDLALLARVVVEGFIAGLHASPHFGSSVEFVQYRPYVQGDDPRFVDWSLYARTDRLHTKQFQEETNLRCTILLDCSASMQFASGPVSKFQYARMLAACLAMLLFQQKDAAGLVAFNQDIDTYIPPRMNALHFHRLLVELGRLAPSGPTGLAMTLQKIGDLLSPRSLVVVLSDFLCPLDEIVPLLKQLRARRHDVLVLPIGDAMERDFTWNRSATLVDAESGQELYIVPAAVREQYLENRRCHFDRLREECLSAEIDMEEYITTEPLHRALSCFLQRRNRNRRAGDSRRKRVGGGV